MENKRDIFLNKVLNILEKPYFRSLSNMGIDDTETQTDILSIEFNEPIKIKVNPFVKINKNIYDKYGKLLYFENDFGYWEKREYDSEGNRIYLETSYGYWTKREYDSKGNEIYYEDSKGIIMDKRNTINESEDKRDMFVERVLSILDTPYIKSLNNMGIDDKDTHKLIFSKLFNDDVTIKYYDYHTRILGSSKNELYYEDSNGFWEKWEYDQYGNKIYYEDYDGFWIKREYDLNGYWIYFEDSNGEWEKREYNQYGNIIYLENSTGIIIDNRNNINESEDKKEQFINKVLSILELPYFKSLNSIGIDDKDTQELILSKQYNNVVTIEYDGNHSHIYNSYGDEIYHEFSNGQWWIKKEYDSNGNQISFVNSDGYWDKYEYDSNNNLIYHENSDGYWTKREYDPDGYQIYYENSYGKIIDNRNNINESEDKKEQFINKVLSILDTPYFKSLNSIGIDDENIQKLIFSKLYNDNVTIEYGVDEINIYNSNGNLIYYENSDGKWDKWEYDPNGNQTYFEKSNGFWYKIEYDTNGNEIYVVNSTGNWYKKEYDQYGNEIFYENSSDIWVKNEYDSNGNLIYFEDSSGYWTSREYDSNGNEIYYEDSDGKIIDNRNNINESEDKKEQFINKVLSILDEPYFKSLNSIGIDDKDTQKLILSKLYNDDVTTQYGNDYLGIYDSNGNWVYSENPNGEWFKWKYDSKGKEIYYESSDGEWYKREYDSNGKEIHYEDSDGLWTKREYDTYGNKIYYEYSNGGWAKWEYDSNGKEIYYEDSNGEIIDNRNNINESEDKKDMFVNRVLSILELPYIKSLNSMGIDDKDTQELIFSKLFNDDIVIYYGDDIEIYDSNNNLLYYESSNGEWYKREYDSNGKEIHYEDSDGLWTKSEYDSNGNEIYYEISNGEWVKREYDSDGYEIYYENSDGEWYKREYDSDGYEIYYENSDGKIIDNRNKID